MLTHADFRVGMLLRWHGDDNDRDDPDDLGVVVKVPGQNFHGNYHIAWTVTNTLCHHSPEMVDESLYQGQMEIVG